MRSVFVAVALTLTGCATLQQRIETVLADHRGTAEWTRARTAFKKIMRRYAHGENETISDAELDAMFEQYLTLDVKSVRTFLEGQSCRPEPGKAAARYYIANTIHQRHDAFFVTGSQLPLTGAGSQRLQATFSANVLMERHAIDARSPLPPRAAKSGPLSDWAHIAKAMTDPATFDQTFQLRDASQRDRVLAQTSTMDWTSAVSGELFIAPTLEGGAIFSPALFAVYLFRPSAAANVSVFAVISANAGGDPQTPYVGLISDPGEDFQSVTRFAFTYLSSASNLLNYDLVLTGSDPLTFDVRITTAFPAHPDRPYLSVRSSFSPALSQGVVDLYTKVPGVKLILMVRKGALMRDLIRAYFPGSSEAALWEDVGALKGDKKFLDELAAIGLDTAVDLFDSKLWLEKPTVAPDGPTALALPPGVELKCQGAAAH